MAGVKIFACPRQPLKSSYFPSIFLSFLLLLILCTNPAHEHLCSAQPRALRAEVCFLIVQKIIYLPFIVLKFVVATFQKMVFAPPHTQLKNHFLKLICGNFLWITVAFFYSFKGWRENLCACTPAFGNALFQKSSDLKIISYAPQSRRAARHIRGCSHFKKHIPQFLPKRLCTFCPSTRAFFYKKSSSFQSFFLSNCPVLTVVFYGLFLKNKMQGILTGLMFLDRVFLGRKISTLIFGQRRCGVFYFKIKRGAPIFAPTPRACFFIFFPFAVRFHHVCAWRIANR